MTERQPGATGTPHASGKAGASAGDLELLAIEEHFAEAFRTGAGPRLSDYLRRYPAYAEQLTDFMSAFLAEAAWESDGVDAAEQSAEGPGLSPGTQRALDAIRAGLDALSPTGELLRVAEERATYVTQPESPEAPTETEYVTLAALAGRLDLSAEEVKELAHAAATAPYTLSPALIGRITAALGITKDEAILLLASGW